jgi:hypothetical protein
MTSKAAESPRLAKRIASPRGKLSDVIRFGSRKTVLRSGPRTAAFSRADPKPVRSAMLLVLFKRLR